MRLQQSACSGWRRFEPIAAKGRSILVDVMHCIGCGYVASTTRRASWWCSPARTRETCECVPLKVSSHLRSHGGVVSSRSPGLAALLMCSPSDTSSPRTKRSVVACPCASAARPSHILRVGASMPASAWSMKMWFSPLPRQCGSRCACGSCLQRWPTSNQKTQARLGLTVMCSLSPACVMLVESRQLASGLPARSAGVYW
mmetsp:Transcript_15749/g.40137  ORF Transcript_15749/g.40137 Transcript_15749/m.40137 type:complete len:200 (+) Transcript_15749:507-1106(+)